MNAKKAGTSTRRPINARTTRIILLMIADAAIVNLAAFLSLMLRMEFNLSELVECGFLDSMLSYAPLNTVTALIIILLFGLYDSMWEFAGVDELINSIFAALCISASNLVGMFCFGMIRGSKLFESPVTSAWDLITRVFTVAEMPKSFPAIYILVLIAGIGGARLSYRLIRRKKHMLGQNVVRTMVIGAGRAGAIVIRDLTSSSLSDNRVVCIIDDDPSKLGAKIYGVKVVGGSDTIKENVKKYGVDEILFAIPTASASRRREILGICSETGCQLKILPGLYQLASGEVRIEKQREVRIEDLLGRDSVKIDPAGVSSTICGMTALVTGGGGSIGSELCRQIAACSPKKLIVFDIYENNAYAIQQELLHAYPNLDLTVLIGSVRDVNRVNEVFSLYRPDLVFHAAAHKHVPLMESSPLEAVKNNVFGTLTVARAADKYGTRRMCLISTDKAVNPTNVMGATKRICEMIVQYMDGISKTDYVAVRFGNVLGSNGSVIPLFRRQIAYGGPVTVTHKDITRFFMTIPEAVSLILQAGAFAQGGEIFVLDMGEPVKIDTLARNMIRLSGYEPDVDIKIVYTGLRPGEKLYEEVLISGEGNKKTENELIFIREPLQFSSEKLLDGLDKLHSLSDTAPVSEVKHALADLVDTYTPDEREESAAK